MNTISELDYSTLLASSIHEVKNSLNMLLNSIDEVLLTSNENDRSKKIFSQIQYEGKRVNDDLVGLLAIYRIKNEQYTPNIDNYCVLDFIEENLLQHEVMIRYRKIEKEIICEPDLCWCFDRDLISGVLSNIINNLYKYTNNKLHISVETENKYLVIRIKDNGDGYPDNMLIDHKESDNEKSISFEKT